MDNHLAKLSRPRTTRRAAGCEARKGKGYAALRGRSSQRDCTHQGVCVVIDRVFTRARRAATLLLYVNSEHPLPTLPLAYPAVVDD